MFFRTIGVFSTIILAEFQSYLWRIFNRSIGNLAHHKFSNVPNINKYINLFGVLAFYFSAFRRHSNRMIDGNSFLRLAIICSECWRSILQTTSNLFNIYYLNKFSPIFFTYGKGRRSKLKHMPAPFVPSVTKTSFPLRYGLPSSLLLPARAC